MSKKCVRQRRKFQLRIKKQNFIILNKKLFIILLQYSSTPKILFLLSFTFYSYLISQSHPQYISITTYSYTYIIKSLFYLYFLYKFITSLFSIHQKLSLFKSFQIQTYHNQIIMHNTQNTRLKGTIKVRVYVLLRITQPSGTWEQVGTGQISFLADLSLDNQTNYQYLVVSPLVNGKISALAQKIDRGKHPNYILYSRLDKINRYQKQQATIISWQDKVLNHQIAISFIQKEVCDDYWKLICSKIGKNHLQVGNLNPGDILEMPNQNNLVYIMNNVKNRQDLITYHVINKTQFMPSLKQLVNRLQHKEEQGLKFISRITKSIIAYNDTRILQIFFSAEYFLMFLKIITYSEGHTPKINYASIYLQKQSYGTIIQFAPQYIEKIKMQNNIAFYREYILNHNTDTVLQNFLNQVYNQTNLEIISYLSKNRIIDKIALKIQTQFLRVLNFLAQLFFMVKQFQEQLRYGIMDSIYESSILKKIVNCIYNQSLLESLQNKKIIFFQVVGNLGFYGQKMYLDFLQLNLKTPTPLITKLAKSFCIEQLKIKKIITYFFKQQILACHPNDKTQWMNFLTDTFITNIAEYLQQQYKNLKQNNLNNQFNLIATLDTFIDFTISFVELFNDNKVLKMYQKYQLCELALKVFKTKSQKITILKFFKLILSKKQFHQGKQLKQFKDIKDAGKDAEILKYMIKSKMVQNFLQVLNQNYKKNNLLASVSLQILYLIENKNITTLIKQLKQNLNMLPKIPIIQKLMSLDLGIAVDQNGKDLQSKHLRILQQQQEQQYLNSQVEIEFKQIQEQKKVVQQNVVLQTLEAMRKQISNYIIQEQEILIPQYKSQATSQKIQFNISFSFMQQMEESENKN